jgi:hypothetical protein
MTIAMTFVRERVFGRADSVRLDGSNSDDGSNVAGPVPASGSRESPMTQASSIELVEPADTDELSGLERRCLLTPICEVHSVIQRALLGADAARQGTRRPGPGGHLRSAQGRRIASGACRAARDPTASLTVHSGLSPFFPSKRGQAA